MVDLDCGRQEASSHRLEVAGFEGHGTLVAAPAVVAASYDLVNLLSLVLWVSKRGREGGEMATGREGRVLIDYRNCARKLE